MPGIYGFSISQYNPAVTIEKMTNAMHLYNHFIKDMPFLDEQIAAARVHLGHIGETYSPLENDGVFVWVEGEAYNLGEIAAQFDLPENVSIGQALVQAYQWNQLDSFLNKLDGYFCAALYDQEKKQIKLISDRYGMRMLYWYSHKGQFAWASEVKGLLALNEVYRTIDSISLNSFIDLGHMLGEHTWFEQVNLIKPSTVLTFDLTCQTVEQHYYWKWSEIKPSNMTFDQAVNELGHRFIKAVQRRFHPTERIGIALSGGLDSRAIFAAVHHLYPAHKGFAYTFGVDGCDDIKIAKQVIARSNWDYQEFHFSGGNWFTPRIKKIWNTDGMKDMMHMHGCEFLETIAEKIVINLNGYLGDAILGGSYLRSKKLSNKRISDSIARYYYKDNYDASMINTDFYDLKHIDPFLFMNRGRRFINMGSVNSLVYVEQRKPFFDNDIVELAYSLPDEYRLNNKIYAVMLNRFFPEYFKNIPWQKTGAPASSLGFSVLPRRAFNKIRRLLFEALGMSSSQSYTNYSDWIRNLEVSSYLIHILDPDYSVLYRITGVDYRSKYLIPHINKVSNNSELILRVATIEIFLRGLKF